MIASCVRRSTLLLLLSVLFVASTFAGPAELRVLLDADNDPSTGCRVITNLGNVDGVEAVYTTTYDTDAGGNLVVTGISKASCAQPGTVNFTPPQQFDPAGWGIPTDSDGNLNVETRIPATQLPNGVRANMHWVFAGVQGTLLDTVRTDADGNKILFPETATHPHIAGPMGGRDIRMGGNVSDWLGIPPLVSGLASTGGSGFRFNGITAYASVENVFFNFSIQANRNAPVANDDGWIVQRGKTITVNAPGVLTNDFDPNHKPLTAALVTAPTHGTLSLNPNGSFTYVNDGAPLVLVDGFTYRANNGTVSSNVARVTFAIVDNRPPFAMDDSYSTRHGGTLNVPSPGVLVNDIDPDADVLRPEVVRSPMHGAVLLNDDGSFTYTHDGSDTLSDTFTYHDFDPFVVSNNATVTIAIGPDAAPVAVDDSGYTVAEGGTLNVPGLPSTMSLFNNDTDADSPKSSFTATVTQQPVNGTVTLLPGGGFTYVHNGSETTSDTFKYTVSDGIRTSNAATVSITVTPVNDAPVITAPGAQVLFEDYPLQLDGGHDNKISFTDSDANGGDEQVTLTATNGFIDISSWAGLTLNAGANGSSTMTYTGSVAALNGMLSALVFQGNQDYNGPAQMTITVNDLGNSGAGGAKTSSVTIPIMIYPVNDPPTFTAGPDVNVLQNNGPYSAQWATNVSPGPPNESSQTVMFSISNNNPALFSVQPAVSPTGVLTFTPAENAAGSATVRLVLHDDGAAGLGSNTSPEVTFTINVSIVVAGANKVAPSAENRLPLIRLRHLLPH